MVTVSLTTTPKRIRAIAPTLRRLGTSCTKYGWNLVVHVPLLFRNKEEYRIPAELEHTAVIIHRTEHDWGPITKYMGLLHMDLPVDEVVVVVDDDALYSERLLRRLVSALERESDLVHTNCGGLLCPETKRCKEVCSANSIECDYVIGSSGVAFALHKLKGLDATFATSMSFDRDYMWADDIVVSRHFHATGTAIVTLADKKRSTSSDVPGVKYRANSYHEDALERCTGAKELYTHLVQIDSFWPWRYALHESTQTVAFHVSDDGLCVLPCVLKDESTSPHTLCASIAREHGNPTFGDKRRKTVDAPGDYSEVIRSICEECEARFRLEFGDDREFHWRLIGACEACRRQPYHLDHQPMDVDDEASLPLVAIVAIMDGTTLDVRLRDDCACTLPIRKGDALVFRADLAHAGSEYTRENWRLHCDILWPHHKTGIYLIT